MSSAIPFQLRKLSGSFYFWASAGAAAIVFAGFARTYYLHDLFGRPALPSLLHIHGAVMSAWFALLALQSCLIATGRRQLHRTLGWVGVGLAVLIVTLGIFIAVHAAVRDLPKPQLGSIFFLGADTAMVLLFGGLLAAAIALRRRSDMHKRLVLLATLSILPAAIGRLPGLGSIVPVIVATAIAALLCVALDTWRQRRLHPVFGWGAPLVMVALYFAFAAAESRAWTDFATHLLSPAGPRTASTGTTHYAARPASRQE
jgi:hypothetical protein